VARTFTKAELLKIYEEHPLRKTTILARLQKQNRNLSSLTELDLAIDDDTEITDQNHIGGLAFLEELARKAGVTAESVVLDAACGLGGSSRALAHFYGCRVHGVEITELRYRDALTLTELVGLENLVTFTCADFLTADLPLNHFDIVLAQSSFVHFQDKKELVARCASLLTKDGRIAIEDANLRRSASTPDEQRQLSELEDVWKSYIASTDEWLSFLQSSGFRIAVNEDLTEAFREYYTKLLRVYERSAPGTFAVAEVKGWDRASVLAEAGVLGYFRIVASR
jgi:sarcosine/dimethylglycine N-methyltransferase